MGTADEVFAACLLGGVGFAVVMGLSAGAMARARAPRLRLPRLLRVRLPRLRPGAGRVRVGLRPSTSARPPVVACEATLFPPGTLPIMAGLFATLFGAGGLVGHGHLGLGLVPSVMVGVAFGVAGTVGLATLLWRYLLAGSEISEVHSEALFGKTGHVSVAIPEGGVGAVAYAAQGKRVTLPAQTEDGHALGRGAAVMIVDMQGHRAVVEQLDAPV